MSSSRVLIVVENLETGELTLPLDNTTFYARENIDDVDLVSKFAKPGFDVYVYENPDRYGHDDRPLTRQEKRWAHKQGEADYT